MWTGACHRGRRAASSVVIDIRTAVNRSDANRGPILWSSDTPISSAQAADAMPYHIQQRLVCNKIR
jgi:hypothetical protein